MCGICGIFDHSNTSEISEGLLTVMTDTMIHRGPDDQGTYISPDRKTGFGFRRLAIVDLSAAGHQPMCNEDGSVWIVFNGEIYNHADLRKELEGNGHRYHSRTDTESIIHGYEQWGEEVVQRLRGMFAFAIWDQNKRRLFCARDRIGIKPFYYSINGGRFVFGSEIKAILACPFVKREVDNEALYHYLTLATTPPPMTMFKGIKKLSAGHVLVIDENGHEQLRQYWDPIFPDETLSDQPEEVIAERLQSLFSESIRLRMMSDVPFGVFLSGGIDSSLNVALMSRLMDRPVDTFSVAIKDDARSNELSEAQAVAKYFGANHHEVVITPQDFVDFLPKMVWHQDEPLADPVCVPLYFVSKLARENGTIVVQVGEGSDELFAGYTGYAFMADFYRKWYAPFSRLPPFVKSPLALLAGSFLPERKASYLHMAAEDRELFWGGANVFSDNKKKHLLRERVVFDTYESVISRHYDKFDTRRPGADFVDRIIYLELKQRLAELLLMRVDKMTMATSVESRVPYLDHELVRFALSIPSKFKIHNGTTKSILKKAARGIIPDTVIDRPKTGFCGSATNMVRGPLFDHAQRSVMGSSWLQEIMRTERLIPFFAEHRSGKRDRGMAIWCLLNLVEWHKVWME